MADPVPAEADGFRHPSSEAELIALVTAAAEQGRQLRVRGAAHSPSHAVYTDPAGDEPNRVEQQTPPPGDDFNVMLDRYRGWSVRDEGRRLVEAQAGIHLGADPSDPTGTATLETSLLYRLFHDKGWTLSSLGGITHQTVSGFTATGSSGGSVTHSVNDNLWGFRVIDGAGEVHELTCDDPDPGPFYSMAPNMGLLGVVSTVTLQCEDTFNIVGEEAITTIDDCPVDLFGPGNAQRPSLERFLHETEYARIEWWPQRGAERVLVWQATRIAPQLGSHPGPTRSSPTARSSPRCSSHSCTQSSATSAISLTRAHSSSGRLTGSRLCSISSRGCGGWGGPERGWSGSWSTPRSSGWTRRSPCSSRSPT
jgi:hypothetical protein